MCLNFSKEIKILQYFVNDKIRQSLNNYNCTDKQVCIWIPLWKCYVMKEERDGRRPTVMHST